MSVFYNRLKNKSKEEFLEIMKGFNAADFTTIITGIMGMQEHLVLPPDFISDVSKEMSEGESILKNLHSSIKDNASEEDKEFYSKYVYYCLKSIYVMGCLNGLNGVSRSAALYVKNTLPENLN